MEKQNTNGYSPPINFSSRGMLSKTRLVNTVQQYVKKKLVVKGNRAMFLLLRKCRQLQLPVDIQLELFDILVKPIFLYGCEVWATVSVDIIEKIHLRFCKYVLQVNKSTCSNMVYGELGVTRQE